MPDEDRTHPAIWPVLIGVGGLILGVGGSIIWVGGALQQITVNTHRLDTLEQQGSPIVQAIKADLQSVRVTLVELNRQSEKTADIIQERGKILAGHEEALKQITVDLRTLEQFSRDTAERRATLAAQLSALEGRVGSDEKQFADIIMVVRRLRDDISEHERQDEQNLRDQINGLRRNGMVEPSPKREDRGK